MISKEWRDARWKFLVATVPVVLFLFMVSPYAEFVEEARHIPSEDSVQNALRDLSDLYYLGGLLVLTPLAAFLGVASVSGEAGGTILQLLSRPVSRARVLLVKYGVGAGTLLLAAVLGKVALIAMAALRGYPLGQLNTLEVFISVFVLWLGVLFVLGTALLVSVLFQTVIASIVACALTLSLVFALPVVVAALHPSGLAFELSLRMELYTYWMPAYYYYGDPRNVSVGIGGFTAANFLVCLVSAAIPLLATLWLFRRKEY